MKKLFIAIAFSIVSLSGISQAIFVSSGKIEFERKTNVHRLYYENENGEESSWMEEFKKLVPQFSTDYFDLYFKDGKSLYKPGRNAGEVKKNVFFEGPGQQNTVYKDLSSMLAVSQKQVFESQFIINDSINRIQWKMQSETRTIAGFECRKAVGRICDSVVVVAFYTDEIIPSNGPESFSGLPGMILGLAIPRLYTTWFATKLEVFKPADEAIIGPPAKGKKATQDELNKTIDKAIKNWGEKFRDRTTWMATL